MERKLVKQGREALTVTLPSKWLKSKGLKSGDSVFIDSEKNDLIIHSKQLSAFREVTINIVDNERSMCWHKLISKYISGYDEITIIHNNSAIVKEIPPRLIGMIVEDQTSKKIIIKTLITIPENNIEAIIRRIFHMLEYQASLLESLTNGKCSLNDINEYSILLDSNINYCLRYINKYNLKEESYKQFLLCSTIEQAGDMIIEIAKHIKKDKKLANLISGNIKLYNRYFFDKDFVKLYTSLRTFRNSVLKKNFVDGLVFQLAELLYNNLGYLMDID